MESIAQNIRIVRENIARICARSNRRPEDVEIVAVSKTKPAALIEQAVQAGIKIIGENRVQEAAEKKSEVVSPARWHLVGHLQTNKVRKALQLFDLIESVDSLHLAEALDRESKKQARTTDILVQVNTSGEASKFGVAPADVAALIEPISENCDSLRIRGLMTIGLFTSDLAKVRPCFSQLHQLSEKIARQNLPNVHMQHLSMGMSGDYEIAVEEGATLLRLGRILFGERG